MSVSDIISEALHLKPQDRYLIIESLVESLNRSDKEIEEIWLAECLKRVEAYKKGKLKTLSYDEVFGIEG
ncbi:MAG: addiction module protein [Campylobacteraceae bacterium]|jgi:putative addiction module component (TIGR02574 family)|nr:addiction module protein [Campylobacteraceae bacterium]